MAGVCRCYSWTYRPLWPLFIFLAAAPCFFCLENPAAVVGKMYPRGNHWAVGHLMGKKSIKSEPVQQETNTGSNYLTPSQTVSIFELDQHHRPVEVLQPKTRKHRLFQRLLHSRWREEDRAVYLQEMSNLLLLALKLQDKNSS